MADLPVDLGHQMVDIADDTDDHSSVHLIVQNAPKNLLSATKLLGGNREADIATEDVLAQLEEAVGHVVKLARVVPLGAKPVLPPQPINSLRNNFPIEPPTNRSPTPLGESHQLLDGLFQVADLGQVGQALPTTLFGVVSFEDHLFHRSAKRVKHVLGLIHIAVNVDDHSVINLTVKAFESCLNHGLASHDLKPPCSVRGASTCLGNSDP